MYKKINYICVQPRTIYYAWQVEVMINNFIKNGVNSNDINILVVWNPNNETCDIKNILAWDNLYKNYIGVNFYVYEDTRINPKYVSSLRPHALKKHFKLNPYLENECFFYHDCDILFTKPNNFDKFLSDNIWYVSDTNSYLNYDYIKSKEYDIYETMCDIVGIDKEVPIKNNNNSGGAQYIMKNVDWKFWEKVETDSENLFSKITYLNNEIKKINPSYHELQIWCADMWAVLWNAWKINKEVKIHSDLDFCWPLDDISHWDNKNIFHNSGATNEDIIFIKSKYINNTPYNITQSEFSDMYCSYNYVKEVLNTKNVSCIK